jgi:hypothetical protein
MSGDIDGQYRKEKRNKLEKVFLDKYLLKLKEKYSVTVILNNGYLINGKYKFYPKANSIHLMESNTWIKKYALNWIKKYLL